MRKLTFFNTVFGRNRDIKQAMVDCVNKAHEENTAAATQLERAIDVRLTQQHSTQHESYRIAHKRRKGIHNPW